ncbi:MAG TPA: DUF3892 domain-containing protein [Pseudobdellovibrionaceae bacterium]
MPKYTKAEPGQGHSVIYTDADGKQWKFVGGSRPWRNQNPGNLVPGNVSKRNGTIGAAGGFAIFPDYETGHCALLDSLKNVHGNKDIALLMKVYAPPKENDTKKYIAFMRKKIGIKGNKKIKEFSDVEFEKLWRAIEQMEGWGKEGTILEYSVKGEITAVKRDKKGTIQSYQIEGYGWVSKSEGVALTLDGKVEAVVATSPKGNQFLRARPNSESSDNLENKG